MGEAAFTYDGQFGAYLLFPGIAVTGYMLGALFFGVYLRRSRAPTVADYFGHRFQSRRLQQFAGFTIILGLGGYLLIVTQGAAILLSDITGLSFVGSLIIAWFSYTLFTMYSGSKGVIITDTLMFDYHRYADVSVVHGRNGRFCCVHHRWFWWYQYGDHRSGPAGKQGGDCLLDRNHR
jgi:sodium/pantothenate symporter